MSSTSKENDNPEKNKSLSRPGLQQRAPFTSTSSNKSPEFHASVRNRRHSIFSARSAVVTVTTATGPTKCKKKNGPAGPTKGKKKKGPPMKKASATKVSVHGKNSRGKRLLVYSGIIDDTIPGIDLSSWHKITFERATGPVNSKGHRRRDHYYYTPKEFRQLSSKEQIKRCVEELKNNGGDEAAAVKLAKEPKTKSSKA